MNYQRKKRREILIGIDIGKLVLGCRISGLINKKFPSAASAESRKAQKNAET